MSSSFVSRKALLIGNHALRVPEGTTSLDCIAWRQLHQLRNPRDFDVIVIDLPEASGVTPESLVLFATKFDVSTMVDLIVSRCQLFLLGDPRLEIPWKLGGASVPGPVADLAGIGTAWLSERGERLEKGDNPDFSPLKSYLETVRSYSYSLESWSASTSLQTAFAQRALGGRAGTKLVTGVRNLLATRAGHPVAFQVHYSALNGAGRVEPIAGRVEFLPRTEKLGDEGARRILELILEISPGATVPSWLSDFSVPGEVENLQAQEEQERRREETDVTLRELREEQEKNRRVLGLLFESGEALESLVFEAMEELGASVEVPTESGQEDGAIVVKLAGENRRAVLEVGGTRGEGHSENRIRQLLAWVNRSLELNGFKSKGVFVGNSSNALDPSSRPFPFSDSWVRSAKAWDFSALRSEDLLAAVLAHRRNELDLGAFWRSIFNESGPVSREKLLGIELGQ